MTKKIDIKLQVTTFIVLMSFILCSTIGYLLNVKLFVVTSNSMQPTFSYGDVLLAVSQEHYYLNDMISYKINGVVVTHRVKSIYTTYDGQSEFVKYQTKGDANKSADRAVIPEHMVIGKIIYILPLIGYLILLIQSKYTIFTMFIFSIINLIYQLIKKGKQNRIKYAE